MKIDRLLGIITILLKKDTVTAPELAEKFEVSRRTINRDIEDLCMAGIPIVTMQGCGGGIRIADGYKVDKTLFTTKEMQAILAGLKSLDSVSGNNQYNQLLDKIYYGSSKELRENISDASGHIVIDLASYYKGSLAPKIELLKEAIEYTNLVEFDYYSNSGDGHRVMEPYYIVFQWSSWYVWGYCLERRDYRLFKLNRIANLHNVNKKFQKRSVPTFQLDIERIFPNNIHLVAEVLPSAKWRLIEEYGIDCFTKQENGLLRFEEYFANEDHVLSWILGFGDQITILEPNDLKDKYLKIISNIVRRYEQT